MGLGQIENKYLGIEYEIKLNIDMSKKIHVDNPLEYIDQTVSLFTQEDFVFANKQNSLLRQSTNYFYGNGEKEGLVLMESPSLGTQIKIKKDLGIVCIGAPEEKFIQKRKEYIDRSGIQEHIFLAIDKSYSEGERYVGSIFRNRGRRDFISAKKGILYEISFDICIFEKEKKKQIKRQMEIEYLGNLPKIPKLAEEEMLNEMIRVVRIIKRRLEGRIINKNLISRISFTNERKYDFLR